MRSPARCTGPKPCRNCYRLRRSRLAFHIRRRHLACVVAAEASVWPLRFRCDLPPWVRSGCGSCATSTGYRRIRCAVHDRCLLRIRVRLDEQDQVGHVVELKGEGPKPRARRLRSPLPVPKVVFGFLSEELVPCVSDNLAQQPQRAPAQCTRRAFDLHNRRPRVSCARRAAEAVPDSR